MTAVSAPGRKARLAASLAVTLLFVTGCAELKPPVSQAAAALRIDVGGKAAGADIAPDFVGLSYEKSFLSLPLFDSDDAPLVALLRRLGPGVLRLGGNSVDRASWDPTGPGLRKGLTAPSDISRLAQFLRAADWRVIYGLNMATSTPQVAEQEASAAHAALGNRLVAFEIGNEPDLYHGNGLRGRDYSYSDWLKEWKSYAEAISSGVPEAEYAGPAAATDLKGFTIPFSRDAAGKASLLTHHYYRADGRLSTSTVELLLSPDPRLPGLINGLADAARSQGIRGGFRLGEANSFFNGGAAHVSDTFASSLWAIDFLFECARGGAEGVNFHGGGESSGYTPIADDGRTVQAVRPEYYGIYLFSMAARGRMLTVNVSTGGNAVSAWAVAARDDSLRVVLLNRSDARPALVDLRLPGAPQTASLLRLTGPSLAAETDTRLSGSLILPDGSWDRTPQAVAVVRDGRLEVQVDGPGALLAVIR